MPPISGYFDIPFAENGDLNTIPDATQPSGTVSYNQGFPVLYSTPVVSGGYNVPRTAINQALNDITTAIQFQQQGNPAVFITNAMNGGSPYSYPQYATVLEGGVAYVSLAGSNIDTPPSSKWAIMPTSMSIFASGQTTGSADAQVTASQVPSGFTAAAGQFLTFVAGFTNTASMTLTANGLSAINLQKNGIGGPESLSGGDVQVGNSYLIYCPQSGVFILLNPTPAVVGYGQCQFQFTSSTVCTLVPKNGNQVTFPSGIMAEIPSSGIATTVTSAYLNGTAAQSLSPSTLYYAYLALISGSYVIDWSTTGHVTDTTTGIEIKSGDATRVLVGMAYPLSGPVFTYSGNSRLVRSWFNDFGISIANTYSANRSTGSTVSVELDSTIRATCILWNGEAVHVSVGGIVSNNTAGASANTGIGLNSTTVIQGGNTTGTSASANQFFPAVAEFDDVGASEGLNFFALLVYVSTGTATWLANETYLGISTRRTP